MENNVKLTWNTLIQNIESNLDKKNEYKELFSLIFNSHCSELEKTKNHAEVLQCFEIALKFFGRDSDILVDLGSFFVKNCLILDVIKSCFKQTKKRIAWKNIRHIANQFQAVNDDNLLKNSFLCDCGNVDVSSLKILLQSLRHKKLLNDEIKIVILSQDIFILNVKKMLRSSSSKFFIDVSGNLDVPRLTSNEQKSIIEGMFEDIRNQLALVNKNNDEIINLNTPNDDNWCLTSIFGYLINYPVLYYQSSIIDTNCLGYQDLKVFQVLIDDDILVSFSVPLNILNNDKDKNIQNHIAAYLERYQNYSNKCHIKSFIANHSHVNL